VLALDFRGRGLSDSVPGDHLSYERQIYATDVLQVLDALSIPKVLIVGTSLGGLVAMEVAVLRPTVLEGVVLNDIGPDSQPAGLERIQAYLDDIVASAKNRTLPRTLEAVADSAWQRTQAMYPTRPPSVWIKVAWRSWRHRGTNGELTPDFDLEGITRSFRYYRGNAGDVWPAFRALVATGRPLLAVRGALSDLLLPETLARMKQTAPHMQTVTIPDVGHAPTLDEPEAAETVLAFVRTCGVRAAVSQPLS
jgi:pimeloyl-ACP methyl ester carboxylesterase